MILSQYSVIEIFDKFIEDETSTLSASLAFYTALSMAPLLIIFVALTTHLSPSLQETFLREAKELVGKEGATSFKMIIDAAQARADLSTVAGWLGGLTLLISASLVFGELRFALNKIFRGEKINETSLSVFQQTKQFLKERFLHIGLALSFLAALILSLVAASFRSEYIVVNYLASWSFSIIFFASVFRFMPSPRAPWRQSLIGGGVTATFYMLGKVLIGIYLKKSAVGSAYGAAGSVVVLMLWIYYSALITLVGAQISSILIEPKSKRI